MLELEDGTIIKKAKGIKNSSISSSDYESMLFKNKDLLAEKSDTKIDLKGGTVNIKSKPTIIAHDSYIKRKKKKNLKEILNLHLWVILSFR